MAFGCLLGSPQGDAREALQDTVAQAVPGLLKYVHDTNIDVADTSGWVLAVVCEHYVDVFLKQPAMLQQLMNAVGPMIGSGAVANAEEHAVRMAKRGAAIVYNLALSYDMDDEEDINGTAAVAVNGGFEGASGTGASKGTTSGISGKKGINSVRDNELSPYYGDLVSVLLRAIDYSPCT
uniref:Importin subunit beta-1 n=1 Tax=Lygus hesperus TaxID=30085 RepID=A0A0A9XZ05_LYGHE